MPGIPVRDLSSIKALCHFLNRGPPALTFELSSKPVPNSPASKPVAAASSTGAFNSPSEPSASRPAAAASTGAFRPPLF